MNQLKFESNNKQWIVSDDNLFLVKNNGLYSAYKDHSMEVHLFSYRRFIYLSQITEEQASEVVEERQFNHFMYESDGGRLTYIESLHSLLKSKGVTDDWINPVIFEII